MEGEEEDVAEGVVEGSVLATQTPLPLQVYRLREASAEVSCMPLIS